MSQSFSARRRINWDALYNELNWDDEEHRRRILQGLLDHRARQYALPKQGDDILDQGEVSVHALSFRLGAERYGIDPVFVSAVRSRPRLTRVPGVPPFYRGIVNVRGQIITAFDLRLFLGLPVQKDDIPREIIVARTDELELAILADHVEEIVPLSRQQIEPLDMAYAMGVTAERLIVLDINLLFSNRQLLSGGTSDE